MYDYFNIVFPSLSLLFLAQLLTAAMADWCSAWRGRGPRRTWSARMPSMPCRCSLLGWSGRPTSTTTLKWEKEEEWCLFVVVVGHNADYSCWTVIVLVVLSLLFCLCCFDFMARRRSYHCVCHINMSFLICCCRRCCRYCFSCRRCRYRYYSFSCLPCLSCLQTV